MARKAKFPLKMADGFGVRTIGELREHFDLTCALGYYASGKLKEWLEGRYHENEAEQLIRLDPSSSDFIPRFCEVLGAECPSETDADINGIAARNAKLIQLKQFTDADEIIQNVDKVAFTQEEMAGMLDDDANRIYLFGEHFTVPLSKDNVVYIGVNTPVVSVSNNEAVNVQEKNISFGNVVFSGSHRKKMIESFSKLIDCIESTETTFDLVSDRARFNRNVICEIDGWTYFSAHDCIYKVSPDGCEQQKLNSLSPSRKHSYGFIQFDGCCIYSGRSPYWYLKKYVANNDATPEQFADYSYMEGFIVYNGRIYAINNDIPAKFYSIKVGEKYNRDNISIIAPLEYNSEGHFYYIYKKFIYYYNCGAIYKQGADNGQAVMLCEVGKDDFYVENNHIYFWDKGNCLNKIHTDGSVLRKTNIIFSEIKDQLRTAYGCPKVCVYNGYIYFCVNGSQLYSNSLCRVQISESESERVESIIITEVDSLDFRVINNHIYFILNDGHKYGLGKYTIDGIPIWKQYFDK